MKTKMILLCLLNMCIYVQVTAQSEITWEPTMEISSMSMYANDHPRIVLDGSGDPMVLWGSASGEDAYFSRWNGTAFTTPVTVNTVPVFAASWAGPDIASFGDTVYVVVKENPEDVSPVHIYTSLNGGVSFTGPVQVDAFISDSVSRFPTVTVDNYGNPIVAFMKLDPDFSNARWVVARSADYGASFSTDVLASGWSGGEVCDCCPSTLINSGNTVSLMYRDNDANIRDSWTGISTDSGVSFTNGFGLDNLGWMLMSCPSSGPDGIILGDTLYSVMMSGYSGGNLVYYSKSSISGLANESVVPITPSIAGLSSQNYPRIASDGNAVGIVWRQTVSGQAQLPILFTSNINDGFPALYDTVDLGDITDADIAIADGVIHVVWEDGVSGTVKYRRGTYNSLAGLESNQRMNAIIYPNPADSKITIQLSQSFTGMASVVVSGINGQQIVSDLLSVTDGQITLDVSELSAGTYIVEIDSLGQKMATQFVKN